MQNELKNDNKTFWIVVDGNGSIFRFKTEKQAVESLEEDFCPEDNVVFEVLGEYKVKSQDIKLQVKTRSEVDFD